MARANASTELSPLTGVLDLRSPPDILPGGSLRWRQNIRTVDRGKVRRAQGFSKLLTNQDPYNNADLHDQLLQITEEAARQPITLLYEAESSRKQKALIVGTESTLYKFSATTGNFAVLGTGYGAGGTSAEGPRFKAARQGDYVIFTNDYNTPKYHVLEQGYPFGDPEIHEFDDLEVIGLTKAKHVWVWKNVVFFADVEMDQGRFPFRVVWGDFDNPTSFDPAKEESIAGQKDLLPNERILGGAPLGDIFLIYTTHNIYEMSAIGGEESFRFRIAYAGDRSNFVGVLNFPNTLVNTGSSHIYVGSCGTKDSESGAVKVYEFSPFQQAPESPEWLHPSTKKLCDEIASSFCNVHVSWMNGHEIYISYATAAAVNGCPNATLRINHEHRVCDYMDRGFTAFCEHNPNTSQTIRDFIIDQRICTIDELTLAGYGFVSEGLPREELVPSAAFEPQVIYSAYPVHMFGTVAISGAGSSAVDGDYVFNPANDRYEHADGYYLERTGGGASAVWHLRTDVGVSLYSNPITLDGAWADVTGGDSPAPTGTPDADVLETEDVNAPTSDEDSLCALLGDASLDNICRACEGDRLFISAYSADWCLKDMNKVMFVELCGNPTDVGEVTSLGYLASEGEYTEEGYDSIMRFSPLYNKDGDVIAESFKLNHVTQPQEPAPGVKLRVGISAQPADPNIGYCGIVWHQRSTQELKCITQKTGQEHLDEHTKPYQTTNWTFWHSGHYLYFELKIEGVGADSVFSGVDGLFSLKGVRNA